MLSTHKSGGFSCFPPIEQLLWPDGGPAFGAPLPAWVHGQPEDHLNSLVGRQTSFYKFERMEGIQKMRQYWTATYISLAMHVGAPWSPLKTRWWWTAVMVPTKKKTWIVVMTMKIDLQFDPVETVSAPTKHTLHLAGNRGVISPLPNFVILWSLGKFYFWVN